MANIDFITFLTVNSIPFANFLKKTGENTKSNKHNIKWKCVLSKGADTLPIGFECLGKAPSPSASRSFNHGTAINYALPKITSDYIIIADADLAMLYKNWDEVIIEQLQKYDCFGSKNVKKNREGLNFPNVPFFCFRKDVLNKIDLDFTPILNKEKNCIKIIDITDKDLSIKWGREIGSTVRLDTGCKLPNEFKMLDLKSKCLEPIDIESSKIQLKFKDIEQKIISKIYHRGYKEDEKKRACQLIEYHYKNEIFCTHLGVSRIRNFEQQPGKGWKNRVENFLKTKYNIRL